MESSTAARYRTELKYILKKAGLHFDGGLLTHEALNLISANWDCVAKLIRGSPPQRAHFQCAVLRSLARDDEREDLRQRARLLDESLPSIVKTQEKTAREEANWVSMKDLKSLAKRYNDMVDGLAKAKRPLTPEDRKTVFAHLMLSLNVDTAPLRNDAADMRICRNTADVPPAGNVMLLAADETTIILREYKTARKYGELRIEVPPKVRKAVERSLKLIPRQYVFTLLTDTSRPMGSNYFSRFFASAIPGFHLGSTLCRKTYISHRYRNDHSVQEREELARRMGHSAAIAIQAYEKH